MLSLITSYSSVLALAVVSLVHTQNCRNIPGSPGFPTDVQWQALNASISGRLVYVVPSGVYCRQTNCTDAEWESANWRNTVPGAMTQVNWEQDYFSDPPSLCGRTTPKTCGQGNVPSYAILAETVPDIQVGVNFARKHNLRLSVKASGHDISGRSTSKYSLLIHTRKLQTIAFNEHFFVGNRNMGSAVTVGSGVGLSALYNASLEVGKIVVGGSAATVVAAGGYVQGAGHSALSPLFGLAADNVLGLSVSFSKHFRANDLAMFNTVTADGILRTADEYQNTDLFWALRGEGAGSWGVIVNATFRTFPTFNATRSIVTFSAGNSSVIGALGEMHAKHIFDWDSINAGHYFYMFYSGTGTTYMVLASLYFPRATAEDVATAMAPLIADFQLTGASLISNTTTTATINTLLAEADDQAGKYVLLGSRLIPATSYETPRKIGNAYKRLIDAGSKGIIANIIAGGKVSRNAYIDSAVNPAWRTAKTHFIVDNQFSEQSTIDEVRMVKSQFQNDQLPILATLQGPVAAAYSNEADPFEKEWQTVFYGPNYGRLTFIKRKYDPTDLFIVQTGIGSERWDSYGLCKL